MAAVTDDFSRDDCSAVVSGLVQTSPLKWTESVRLAQEMGRPLKAPESRLRRRLIPRLFLAQILPIIVCIRRSVLCSQTQASGNEQHRVTVR